MRHPSRILGYRTPGLSRIGAAAAVLMCAVSGCARALNVAPNQTHIRQHAVFVAGDGRAVRALAQDEADAKGVPRNEKMDTVETGEYLHAMMQSIRQSRSDTVLIFVHGGRVTLPGSYHKSVELLPLLQEAGYYPVFVNWDASQWTTTGEHLFRIRQGQDFGRFWGPVTSPFVFVADLGRGVVRAPLTMTHQLLDYCRTTARQLGGSPLCPIPGVDSEKAVALARERDLLERSASPAAAQDNISVSRGDYEPDPSESARRFSWGVVTAVPKVVLTGPVIDGFGAGAWGNMLRRTRTMFRPPAELRALPAERRGYRRPSGAASQLMDSLSAVADERKLRIVLVAHSMGAIIANRILHDYPALPVDRIQYMAAACSVAELEAAVVPFLRTHPGTHFYNLMLHPYSDAGEAQSAYLDLVPRGSLLEWIDDYFTSPETGYDRTAGKWSNAILAEHIFPDSVRGRVHLKSFGYKDPQDLGTRFYLKPYRHGDFSDADTRFWEADFLTMGRPAVTSPAVPR